MDKKTLTKTIISCLIGAVLWCAADFIYCSIEKKSFTETFFTVSNILEMIVAMGASGYVYYSVHKKNNK